MSSLMVRNIDAVVVDDSNSDIFPSKQFLQHTFYTASDSEIDADGASEHEKYRKYRKQRGIDDKRDA